MAAGSPPLSRTSFAPAYPHTHMASDNTICRWYEQKVNRYEQNGPENQIPWARRQVPDPAALLAEWDALACGTRFEHVWTRVASLSDTTVLQWRYTHPVSKTMCIAPRDLVFGMDICRHDPVKVARAMAAIAKDLDQQVQWHIRPARCRMGLPKTAPPPGWAFVCLDGTTWCKAVARNAADLGYDRRPT